MRAACRESAPRSLRARPATGAQASLAARQQQRDSKEAQLSGHPAWPAISRTEARLSALTEQLADARRAAAAREAAADASEAAAALMALVAEVNVLNMQVAAAGYRGGV